MAQSVGRVAARAPGLRWLLLLPPLATLVLVLVDLGAASDGFTAGGGPDASTVALVGWALSPGLGMLVLAVLAAAARLGTRTVLVGGLVLLLATVALVWSVHASESSTAAVGYVTAPLVGWTVVVVTGALLLVARGRSSR